MADYIYINRYDRSGDLAISRKVFSTLASAAVNNTSHKGSIKLKDEPKVIFKKDGRVFINLKVIVKRGLKPTDVCEELQSEVARVLEIYVESIPFEIEISVDEIK